MSLTADDESVPSLSGLAAFCLGKGEMALRRVTRSRPEPGWVTVRVRAAGLCGSDMHRIDAPEVAQGVLGHEVAGILEEIGEGTEGLSVGQHVACLPLVPCGTCDVCAGGHPQVCPHLRSLGKDLPGGFADFMAAPASNVRVVPDHVPLSAVAMADVLAVAMHAVNLAGHPRQRDILVLGDGSTGLACAALLARENRVVVVGRHHARATEQLGAEHVPAIDPDSRFDVIFEAVGRKQVETLHVAIQAARPGGQIVVLGVYPAGFDGALPLRSLFYKETVLRGCNSYHPADFDAAVDRIVRGEIDTSVLVTHQIPLADFERGVALTRDRAKSGALKVVFVP